MTKIKPKLSKWHLIATIFRIYNQEHCPRCKSISPYYNDCPICEGLIIGCSKALKIDILIKYISWAKDKDND